MSQNPLLSKFVSLYNRIEDMQANFNRSRLQEYTALCDKLNANAAKIIKGNHCPHHLEQDNDILVLVIDGKNYELQFNDIVMLLDDEEIQRLTNAQREKEKEKERKERREGQKMKNNNTAQDMNNPFSAMAQYLWAPFMSMAAAQGLNQIPIAEPKETSILEDLNAIQKKVILLEEKNKNSSELEDKISELNESIQSLDDEMNGKKTAMEQVKPMYDTFKGWATEFNENMSTERKKMIISQLFSRIELYKGYDIHIELNMDYKQFCEDWSTLSSKSVEVE